jgi:hypothetical protein
MRTYGNALSQTHSVFISHQQCDIRQKQDGLTNVTNCELRHSATFVSSILDFQDEVFSNAKWGACRQATSHVIHRLSRKCRLQHYTTAMTDVHRSFE